MVPCHRALGKSGALTGYHWGITRKQAMLDLMWDEGRGFFFDYDFARRQRSSYISATGLYPLWAKLLDANDPVDRKRVGRLWDYARQKLEQPAGLAATARESLM